MLRQWEQQLTAEVGRAIERLYGLETSVVIMQPPSRELGDVAFPVAMGLARELRRNPREIAGEIGDAIDRPDFVSDVKVEGAGYLNVFLRRERLAAALLEDGLPDPPTPGDLDRVRKVVVEHTNINPNKAAHIGHLRNAVLGDILVRVLERVGYDVEVQNYIDDTGVQLADVVVGFLDLERRTLDEIAALPEPFDHHCWDLYAEVGRWYEEDGERLALRRRTLHELESGEGERAEVGRLVARRVVARHLATMDRLSIGYDLLTHESAILTLDFFSTAFEQLRQRGAVALEEEGKNAGCWVMPLSASDEFAGLEDPDKVIVRSDGTVTYVGKDIAYQLWKFGLLGRDFRYRRWEETGVWETAAEGEENPHGYGGADRVVNVIDARQSYLQKVVRAGLEALGHEEAAAESVHFAYEMVSLSRGTARQLGFLPEGDDDVALEMSGRKGIGVKADDLLDRLESAARDEVSQRNPEMPADDLDRLARQIAVAALRFFMAKATTTRVIAFDLDEALAFEGETGPYLQYSTVRVRNIRRKLEAAGFPSDVTAERIESLGGEAWQDDLWDLALAVATTPEAVARTAESLELSIAARHALDLAQKFNAIYHRHPILQEEDEAVRDVRLAAARLFETGIEYLADLLGIPLPERM
ncbi:MAG: arginine--tRNA ligase [Thermoanaerobaculia bacterium]|nr:arginine--tRNA ligase [Thermoanaerobaculia bacterium]